MTGEDDIKVSLVSMQGLMEKLDAKLDSKVDLISQLISSGDREAQQMVNLLQVELAHLGNADKEHDKRMANLGTSIDSLRRDTTGIVETVGQSIEKYITAIEHKLDQSRQDIERKITENKHETDQKIESLNGWRSTTKGALAFMAFVWPVITTAIIKTLT